MKILFDLLITQPSGVGIFHGGGEYAKTVFEELLKQIDKSNTKVSGFLSPELPVDKLVASLITKYDVEIYYIRVCQLKCVSSFFQFFPQLSAV